MERRRWWWRDVPTSPASMFQLLSCTVTMEGGTVALRTEGAPPAEDEPPSGGAVEYQTAAEAEQAVGFPLKAPGELGAPEKIQVISGAVAQLNWPEGISYQGGPGEPGGQRQLHCLRLGTEPECGRTDGDHQGEWGLDLSGRVEGRDIQPCSRF